MQEKQAFSSYLDFFFLTYGRGMPTPCVLWIRPQVRPCLLLLNSVSQNFNWDLLWNGTQMLPLGHCMGEKVSLKWPRSCYINTLCKFWSYSIMIFLRYWAKIKLHDPWVCTIITMWVYPFSFNEFLLITLEPHVFFKSNFANKCMSTLSNH